MSTPSCPHLSFPVYLVTFPPYLSAPTVVPSSIRFVPPFKTWPPSLSSPFLLLCVFSPSSSMSIKLQMIKSQMTYSSLDIVQNARGWNGRQNKDSQRTRKNRWYVILHVVLHFVSYFCVSFGDNTF